MHFSVARLPVQAVARPMSRHEPGTRMSVLLANPDYLLEGFAEKKCQVRCKFQLAPCQRESFAVLSTKYLRGPWLQFYSVQTFI